MPDVPIQHAYTFNEAAIQLAIQYEKEVQFSYPSSRGSLGRAHTNRRFLPQVLSEIRDNKVVTGHDIDRDDVRAFRVDRIVGNVVIR